MYSRGFKTEILNDVNVVCTGDVKQEIVICDKGYSTSRYKIRMHLVQEVFAVWFIASSVILCGT